MTTDRNYKTGDRVVVTLAAGGGNDGSCAAIAAIAAIAAVEAARTGAKP